MFDGGWSNTFVRRGLRPVATRLLVVAAAFALAAVGSIASPPTSARATADIGYQDQSFSGTTDPTGTKRSESVLWFNDGSWWASMWDTVSQEFHIFRLDLSSQSWINTGVTLDTRSNTSADVLWDGTHLYVASHRFVADGQAAISGYPSYLYRFSYDAAAKTHSLDAGFPVQINNYRTETLVIDKDSTGKLWATWQQGNAIYVNRTLNGDDRSWGTPFVLPVSASSVTVDDNSAVVAFDGNKIGMMWSNQSSANDAMWFAVHVDGDPDTTWQAARTAIQGPNTADDHMNLKALQTDSAGRVYAAVKTSFTSSAQPLIMLLVRDPSTGAWASFTISRVSDCPNRPIVLIDEENRVLHSFFTAPGPPGFSCNSSGGAIYEKTSLLDTIAFPTGSGTAVILDADSPYVHNVSSTKQNVSSGTGIALLARNSNTQLYWHQYQPISPATPPTPPTASFAGTPTFGTAPLSVAFTDASTGNPTSWSWSFGDGGTSSGRNPTHTYTSAGTYTVALTVSNTAGTDIQTRPDFISVTLPPPPTASFTGAPTSGTVPLSVAFTDTSSGNPTSWSWSFGDGSTSTSQNPTHVYTAPGTYTVALTATNAGGSNTLTRSNYISVTPPPPDFTVTASPAKRTVVRGATATYTVTLAPVNAFAGSVTLTVSGLPTGAIAAFNPNPLDLPTNTTSVLSVATTSATTRGSYTLTITAASGSLSHTTSVVLQVKT